MNALDREVQKIIDAAALPNKPTDWDTANTHEKDWQTLTAFYILQGMNPVDADWKAFIKVYPPSFLSEQEEMQLLSDIQKSYENVPSNLKPSKKVVEAMLGYVPANSEYSFWRNIVWSIHDALGNSGLSVAIRWSMSCPEKFDYNSTVGTYDSFEAREGGITFKTLEHFARLGGYVGGSL